MENKANSEILRIVDASEDDLGILMRMNLDLMEDERYDRPPSGEILAERWKSFLGEAKYGTWLFKSGSDVVGYAVVHLDEDPRYLRHFYIVREHRREGWGTLCFNALLNHLDIRKIDLDVMSWNERGMGFWKSLGFRERCVVMAYEQ